MREQVVAEVSKLLDNNNAPMYVIGYLEGALSFALEQMPRSEAERLMQVYFYNREAK